MHLFSEKLLCVVWWCVMAVGMMMIRMNMDTICPWTAVKAEWQPASVCMDGRYRCRPSTPHTAAATLPS